jgi:hypothetical protein
MDEGVCRGGMLGFTKAWRYIPCADCGWIHSPWAGCFICQDQDLSWRAETLEFVPVHFGREY